MRMQLPLPSLRNGRNANGQWAKNVVDPLRVEVARANEQFGPGILLPKGKPAVAFR